MFIHIVFIVLFFSTLTVALYRKYALLNHITSFASDHIFVRPFALLCCLIDTLRADLHFKRLLNNYI